MAYKRKTWKNDSSTPLNADGLNDFEGRVGDEFVELSNKVQEVDNVASTKHEVRTHITTITLVGGGAHIWWDNTTFISVQIIELLDAVEGITYGSDIGVTNMYNDTRKSVTSYFFNLKTGARIPAGTRLKVAGYYLVR